MSLKAWVEHLQGNFIAANFSFLQVSRLQKEVNSNPLHNVRLGEHLLRTDKVNVARKFVKENLGISGQKNSFYPSAYHRILGDVESKSGNHSSARTHYESALKIARSISDRAVLIEALLARGRFYAKANPLGLKDLTGFDPFPDLNEALNYAVESGYRIYEADIRVVLAWAWLSVRDQGSGVRAKAEAERALQMSTEMGYYWGKVDAEEILNSKF